MATHRQAAVEVVNKTGGALLSVSISHKYSDNYKNSQTWERIKHGEATSTTKVDYNTGLVTTGRDWWVVTWVDDNGHTYITNPKNFRDILDFLEKVGDKIAGPAARLAALIAIGNPEPNSKAVAAAVAITSAVAAAFLNSEGTAGFKQHILRTEDRAKPTRIIITKKRVEFNSKSGTSRVGFRRM